MKTRLPLTPILALAAVSLGWASVASISLSTILSELIPSASAAKFGMIRCLSTGCATALMSSVATWYRP